MVTVPVARGEKKSANAESEWVLGQVGSESERPLETRLGRQVW